MQLEMGTRKEDGKSDLGDSEIHDLEELLSEVKGHLEACQTCVHEAERALAKLTGRVELAKLKEPGKIWSLTFMKINKILHIYESVLYGR